MIIIHENVYLVIFIVFFLKNFNKILLLSTLEEMRPFWPLLKQVVKTIDVTSWLHVSEKSGLFYARFWNMETLHDLQSRTHSLLINNESVKMVNQFLFNLKVSDHNKWFNLLSIVFVMFSYHTRSEGVWTLQDDQISSSCVNTCIYTYQNLHFKNTIVLIARQWSTWQFLLSLIWEHILQRLNLKQSNQPELRSLKQQTFFECRDRNRNYKHKGSVLILHIRSLQYQDVTRNFNTQLRFTCEKCQCVNIIEWKAISLQGFKFWSDNESENKDCSTSCRHKESLNKYCLIEQQQ